jgi:hypothetical protein
MPLQNLDIGFFQIETACQHFGYVPIASQFCRLIEEFHDAAILAVFNRVFGLRDEVGVIFSAHGYGA